MKKPETPSTMAVSITAFICNLILVIIFCTRFESFESAPDVYIPIFAALIIVFILTPIAAKFNAYNAYFNPPQGFSAPFAVREYQLKGWIRGKYLFLDAIHCRVNGDFQTAVFKYNKCLKIATNKQLRLACYKDMSRYMSKYIVLIPILIEATKEFPEEAELVNAVSQYFMWCPTADPKESEEWFSALIENKTVAKESLSLAYTFIGLKRMYSGKYEEAIENFKNAIGTNNSPPAYLSLDIAVCCACIGDLDAAREHAVIAAATVDDKGEIDYIKEKMDYVFKAKTNAINPETQKLVAELARRDISRSTESLDNYRENTEVK